MKIQAGDPILVRNHLATKFEPQWSGPFQAVEIDSEGNISYADATGLNRKIHCTDTHLALDTNSDTEPPWDFLLESSTESDDNPSILTEDSESLPPRKRPHRLAMRDHGLPGGGHNEDPVLITTTRKTERVVRSQDLIFESALFSLIDVTGTS